jgi:putative colanic acid biosynthesis UDP-glucose lipid carrier transferase
MRGARYYSLVSKVMIFIIDFWLVNLAFEVADFMGFHSQLTGEQRTSFFLIFGLVWIVSGFFNRIYRIDTASLMRNVTIDLGGCFLVHFVIVSTLLLGFNLYSLQASYLAAIYFFTAVFIVIFRLIYKLVLKYYQFSGFDQRKVIIIGATGSGTALYQYFSKYQSAGYQFSGFFDDDKNHDSEVQSRIIGGLNTSLIKEYCKTHNIGEIYFALPLTQKDLLEELSRFADDNFIYFRIAPDFSKVVNESGDVFLINSVPVLTTRKEPLGNSLNRVLKRIFDIAFSLTVILTLFPVVLPLIALAIRLDSPGPIFFKQLRPGKRNKLFDCYKFRTMKVNNLTEVQATKNDSRITNVGRFLRKTNLDELPQFFNVLLGNMSVVGPRPNMVSQLEHYSKCIHNYKVRHFVTPGITGYAQVNGFRGETKELELMEKRVQYDVKYIENWSLALDIKIILLTVWNMLKGEKNAY